MPNDQSMLSPRKVPPKQPMGPGPLRFGIDIDGTISQAPNRFRYLIHALMERGNEAYIITARREGRRKETVELLAFFGIRYTELVMRPDDWQGPVAEFKVQRVKEKNVHIMIDDNEETCWAVEQQTQALAAHMLPIPEMPEAREAETRLGHRIRLYENRTDQTRKKR